MSERFTGWLIAARWPLLLLAAILAVVCYPAARSLDFDRSVENMFAPDDPLLPSYRALKRTFGGNEIVLVVFREAELMNPQRQGVERLADITADLAGTPGVHGVLSLSELDTSLAKMAAGASLLGLNRVPPRGIVDPESDLAVRFRRMFQGYTHGADGVTAAVVCMLEPESQSPVPRRETIERLRAAATRLPSGQITGEPVMLVDGFRYIEEDANRLGWTCTLLLSLTILICFRSLRWMLIAVGVVQLALLLTRGLLVWSGLRMSMVSSMLTAIITVVGIATVVHVIVRFRAGRLAGLAPRDALLRAGGLVAMPVFWSIITDAVGFGSLLIAGVGPVRDFGLMTALGSLMVLVAVILLVPGLALLGWHPATVRSSWVERLVVGRLSRSLSWVERRPLTLAAVLAVVLGGTAAGVYLLEVETDFTKNFRQRSPIVQAYNTVETNLGGAGIWDVLVPAPETLSWPYLQQVLQLEDRLRREVTVPGPDGRPRPALKVLSMADTIEAGAPSLRKTRSGLRQAMVLSGAVASLREHMPAISEVLYAEDPLVPGKHYFRIMLRAVERQPAQQKLQLIEDVTRISREAFPEAEVTGFFVLLTNLVNSILRDQWTTFALALSGICLAILLAFLRPRFALIAMVPNAMPILLVTGLMGWLGLRINMGAAMIAAVSMGLSVDSSIHYLRSFVRARADGKTVAAALAEVQQSVGLAMVFSTFSLIVGFSVLAFSEFVPTIYFGVLVCLTMLGGLLGNLLILPLLLWLTEREGATVAP